MKTAFANITMHRCFFNVYAVETRPMFIVNSTIIFCRLGRNMHNQFKSLFQWIRERLNLRKSRLLDSHATSTQLEQSI